MALSEHLEGRKFVAWLKSKDLLFSHLPLNTWTRSYKQLAMNKASGVHKGVPDYVIVVPEKGVIFVELKREFGGKVSSEQKEWISALTLAGCPSRVCCGAGEAIAFVEEYL